MPSPERKTDSGEHIDAVQVDDKESTGNEDEAVATGSQVSSLVTDATNHNTEPNHSNQHEPVTATVIEVDQAKPSPPQQPHPANQLQQQLQTQQQQQLVSKPHQQLPTPPQHLQQQLVPLQQLQQQVGQPQQREVGHELDELDEIIHLASGLTNNHHSAIERTIRPTAIKQPRASRAFAMKRITWEARRHTKISPDLEDVDLNLIDRGGLPWLP
ncbi:nuclear transcription factor Y subunit beta-like [Asterias rubens]|uniref:nuclear transcription factor Y subunit beta-like n=1 Tax=Asterias rubens TaxID=7604 RepID=UPI001455193D|nr:nuclear transcription factor Y subunit beta-like [Asterias rubens]